MKYTTRWWLPPLLPLLFAAVCPAQELVWNSDFSRGLRGWKLDGNSKLKREGATMLVRLVGPKGNGVAECRSPVLKLSGEEGQYELICTYRTEIKQSHLHGGAWLIHRKLDAAGKLVGEWTGLILKASTEWGVAKGIIKIPVGVKTFETGIRVQGRPDRVLDVKSVSLRKIR